MRELRHILQAAPWGFLTAALVAAPGCLMDWEDPTPADAAELDSIVPDGLTQCGSDCVNLLADHENCGSCGRSCPAMEYCNEGECVLECPTGRVACSGYCTDTLTDIFNCGACSSVCPSGLHADPLCEGGECGYDCHPGWSDLDSVPGCETECHVTSTTEICNGVDDNCDGTVDEGFDCAMGMEAACETVCGSTGRGTCGLDCSLPGPSQCNPPGELCNGLDDDCDGAPDNGLPCLRGTEVDCTTSCGTAGRGTCTAACEIPTGSDCASLVEEVCNDVDDDCDTIVDEGCGTDGDGDGYSAGEDCDDTNRNVHPGATEVCNGIDDDCDTSIDEGNLCTSPPGACYESTGTCTGGDCSYTPKPSSAVCNDADACTTGDHCDGSGNCVGTTMDCSRPHTTGGHCVSGSCTGWSCVSPWSNCNSNWSDGCEIPTATAARCDRSGLNSTSGCGTAYCGSSGASNAQNFGTWYCIGCTTCHHFADGWSWCLSANLQWSPDRCDTCCNSSFEDLVCSP
jgi:hypothetical protein